MSADWFQDLVDFSRVCGCHIGESVTTPPRNVVALRHRLHDEEHAEVLQEMVHDDHAALAKELCDNIYVLLGTAVAYGIDLRPVWNAVHESNMAKARGPVRADGKRLKPPGWKKPDIGPLLKPIGEAA